MSVRIGFLLIVTGAAFFFMHWLGPVGPFAVLIGAGLLIQRLDVRRNSRDSRFHSTLRQLARIDAPRNAA